MKYHPVIKGLAIVLAAVALIVCAAGAFGMLALENYDLYTISFEEWNYNMQESLAYTLAYQVLQRYTAQTFSNCPPEVLAYLDLNSTDERISNYYGLSTDDWQYRIQDAKDHTYLDGVTGESDMGQLQSYYRTLDVSYPVLVSTVENGSAGTETEYTWHGEDDGCDPTEMPVVHAMPIDTTSEYDDILFINDTEYRIKYAISPSYTVTVWLTTDAAWEYNGYDAQLLSVLYQHRYTCIWVFGISLVCFLLLLVYLCFAAGRSRDGSSGTVSGLNRLPLDLYLVIAGGIIALFVSLFVFLGIHLWNTLRDQGILRPGIAALAGTSLLLASLTGMSLLYALICQIKMKDRFWWKNSMTGRFLRWVGKGIRFVSRALGRLFSLLPLIWQWLLTAVAMVVTPLFFLWLAAVGYSDIQEFLGALLMIGAFLGDIALVCYGAYAFGLLLKGAREMSQGNLDTKICTKYLYGMFRRCAEYLNTLSDAAVLAARNQMKSERMKTELITNVSHDIKTPLTSIINYVDLLQKPHAQEENAQYLQVLDRQSQRLKKLIDDLMEMSKASTGNMAVEAVEMDLTESINQALGEFADKLSGQSLQVIFPAPAEPVPISADGRLTWRVLSNLLGNVVKYALPGTRVYLDISKFHSHVLLSVKNISKESLNVSAEELTERFVRGDASRNTEGSGLGLNIAKSLMELQKGQLNLLVDGDLFKVTLTFPAAQ